MYKEAVLEMIRTIQARFPEELLEALVYEKIDEENIDEYYSRSLLCFSPVYLPIFISNADLISVHLEIGKPWESGAWVELEHDEEFPRFIASSFKYLPYSFVEGKFNCSPDDEVVYRNVRMMLDDELEMPPLELVKRSGEEYGIIMERYDLGDLRGKIARLTSELRPEEAKNKIEQIYSEHPDDVYALAAVAWLRKELGEEGALDSAQELLQRELPFPLLRAEWIPGREALEILEELREFVAEGVADNHNLAPLESCSYIGEAMVSNFLKVAINYQKGGEPQVATNILRAGAAVLGVYGGGIPGEWCEILAGQSEVIEKGNLCANLAYYAAQVADMGP